MKKTSETSIKKKIIIFLIIAFIGGLLGFFISSAFKFPSSPPSTGKTIKFSRQQAEQIFILKQEIVANPGNAKAWVELGDVYFDTNNYAKSIKAYNKSLELLPNDPNVLTDLGIMYQRIDQPEKAIEMFEKAAAVDPRHEESRFNKGVVLLYDFKDKEGTIAAWEDLLKANQAATAPNGQPISEIITNMKEEK